jgi:hypothetical protein
MNSYLLILGIIISFSIGANSSFAQTNYEPGLTIRTNNASYDVGDTITILGTVTTLNEDADVIIQLWKDGDMINIKKMQPDQNGDYSYTLLAEGPKWTDGTYVAKATYGQGIPAETIFSVRHLESIEQLQSISDSSGNRITIKMTEKLFYLDVPNQIIRATVEIQDYTPSDGFHFMKVIHLPTNKVMKDFEIYPKNAGNDLWSVQIAYPILESDINVEGQALFGEYEIQIRSEYGADTGSAKFSILETSFEPESKPEPVVEETPEPVVEETPEIIEENEKNDSADDQVTIQINEGFIEELIPILPYLGIVIAGIIVGIIVLVKKSNRNDDDFSDDEYEDDSIIETSSLTPKFQDMQTGSSSDSLNDLEPHQIIEDKIRRISKLQENKIGDYNKLEEIKKSLIDDGTFTQADNDYLEEKYEEYEKSKDS